MSIPVFYFFHHGRHKEQKIEKEKINKVVPQGGRTREFPVTSVLWAKLRMSPWWPSVYICVCLSDHVVPTVCFLTFHILTNKMHKLQYNET
jgi:hypothetical protein